MSHNLFNENHWREKIEAYYLSLGAIGLGIFIFLLFIGFWMIYQRQEKRLHEWMTRENNDQSIQILTQWLQDMRGSVEHQTSKLYHQVELNNQAIGNRLDSATRVISDISRELGQIQEIGRQIQKFQDVLQSPKLRGNLGEHILYDLLEQVLPKSHFRLQHRFRHGQVVDATILTDKGLLPIDAKFPLNNFRRAMSLKADPEKTKAFREFARDVKKYIDSVSSKYILPEEGTLDFAIIYIPSEPIYYEIIQQGDHIYNYAHQKNVLLVSPNSFYYFLKIIMIALEGKRIEEVSQRILKVFAGIRRDTCKVSEGLRILTSHIVNAKNAIDRTNNEFLQLANRIEDTKYLENEKK